MNTDEYSPQQRAVFLFMALSEGAVIEPQVWADKMGLKSRQAVHHQLDELSAMGIPVVRIAAGKWALAKFADRLQSWADEE